MEVVTICEVTGAVTLIARHLWKLVSAGSRLLGTLRRMALDDAVAADIIATMSGKEKRRSADRVIVATERIERTILLVRGHKVILDADIAELYGVEIRALTQAVKRNLDRFPGDFMFQLTWPEARALRSQFVTLDGAAGAPGSAIGVSGRGRHRKFRPYAFTEQGVAMLSSILRSKRAVRVNIEIMRAFVRLRSILASHADLARKLNELEKKYDRQFSIVFDAIRELMQPAPPTSEAPPEWGFHVVRRERRGRGEPALRAPVGRAGRRKAGA